MLTKEVAHYIVELTAAVDLLSGTRSSNLDDLLELRLPLPETTSRPKTAAASEASAGSQPPVTGLLMEKRNPAFNGSRSPDPSASAATIRAPWIDERFGLYRQEFERAVENEAAAGPPTSRRGRSPVAGRQE